MEIKLNKVLYEDNKYPLQKSIIINNVTATIKNNQITSFVGPSGSGKTTLAELIAHLKTPDQGEIIYEKKQDLTSKIALVYQHSNDQFFCDTIEEEMEFALNNFNYQKQSHLKRIKDSLKLVGLKTDLTKSPNLLSKGEQKLLSLAIALSYNPEVIIFDEPTTELDSFHQEQLAKLIKMMKLRYNKTIIIFSKDTDFVHQVSDYIYILNKGKIITKGKKYKVLSDFKMLEANNLVSPHLIEFPHLVETKKSVKIGYRDDINDLMKDVFRYVR